MDSISSAKSGIIQDIQDQYALRMGEIYPDWRKKCQAFHKAIMILYEENRPPWWRVFKLGNYVRQSYWLNEYASQGIFPSSMILKDACIPEDNAVAVYVLIFGHSPDDYDPER